MDCINLRAAREPERDFGGKKKICHETIRIFYKKRQAKSAKTAHRLVYLIEGKAIT